MTGTHRDKALFPRGLVVKTWPLLPGQGDNRTGPEASARRPQEAAISLPLFCRNCRALRAYSASSPLSSPGSTGRSSSHRPSIARDHRGYWIPAFAGMTGERAAPNFSPTRHATPLPRRTFASGSWSFLSLILRRAEGPSRRTEGGGAPKSANLWLRVHR
jgi:hypothetical protein